MSGALVRYEAARQALADAVSFDEVMTIMDVAEQAALYAKQANDTDLIEKATEIRVRAQRKAGEMLAMTPKNKGTRTNGKDASGASVVERNDHRDSPTLAEMGVTKDQSSRYQQLAAMPDEHFETAVATAKATAGEVTTAFMLREAKAVSPTVKAAATKKANAKKAAEELKARLREMDERVKSPIVSYGEPLIRALRKCVDPTPEEQKVIEDLRTAIARMAMTVES